MTPPELHTEILKKFSELKPNFEMGPLHKAVLMECCENVSKADGIEKFDPNMQIIFVMQAFEVSRSLLRGLIRGIIPEFGDIVNLNYRGESFSFNRDSPLVKDALNEK